MVGVTSFIAQKRGWLITKIYYLYNSTNSQHIPIYLGLTCCLTVDKSDEYSNKMNAQNPFYI